MSIPLPDPTACPACNTAPGTLHSESCDIARCAITGQQRGACHLTCNTVAWTGHWPGTAECFELGWTIPDVTDIHGNPMPDLNRLHAEYVWDINLQRMVPPAPATP
ncbi:hypothetical protein ACFWF9_02840 [Streptomyces roseolus]|uniref:hypothetical protein n=1 Tax=Streptomyces roseolus TaxID=67358 RepID=UPI003662052E